MAGKVRHLVVVDGIHYARVAVPAPLRAIVGKRELRKSIGSSRREALERLPGVVAEFKSQIEAARVGGQSLGEDRSQIGQLPQMTPEQIAAAHFRWRMKLDRQHRNDNSTWTAVGIDEMQVRLLDEIAAGKVPDQETEGEVGALAHLYARLGAHDLKQGTAERRELLRLLALAEAEALKQVADRDDGIFTRPVPEILTAPLPSDTFKPSHTWTIMELFEGYIAELSVSGRGRGAATRWRPVFERLEKFLGHGDAQRVTKSDLVRWKDDLLGGLSTKTIRDVHLAAVRAVFKWAVDNERLSANPADGVKVRHHPTPLGREKGLTDREANAVLRAALTYEPKRSANPRTRESTELTAAKRWSPWLCAFLGCRIAEITQLRKGDVREE